MAQSGTAALIASLMGKTAPGSPAYNGSGGSKQTNTRPDGTYTIGNSTNRLARIYLVPSKESSGLVTQWRAEAIESPRIIPVIQSLFDLLIEDLKEDQDTPLHQRPAELDCGITARMTEKLTYHGEKFSAIIRLSDGDLPKPRNTDGAKVEGKGKIRRGDNVLIDDENLVDMLNTMAQAAMERGQVSMGASETE